MKLDNSFTCFLCDAKASVVDFSDVHNEKEFRCIPCSVAEFHGYTDWVDSLIAKADRRYRARQLLKELLEDD